MSFYSCDVFHIFNEHFVYQKKSPTDLFLFSLDFGKIRLSWTARLIFFNFFNTCFLTERKKKEMERKNMLNLDSFVKILFIYRKFNRNLYQTEVFTAFSAIL